jgi:hypothetical protein
MGWKAWAGMGSEDGGYAPFVKVAVVVVEASQPRTLLRW